MTLDDKARQIIDEFIDDLDNPASQQDFRDYYHAMLSERGSDTAYYLYANNILNLADPEERYPASIDAYGSYAWEAVILWKNSTPEEFQKRIANVLDKLWPVKDSADFDTQELIALIRMDLVESFKTVDWYLQSE